VKAGLAAAWLAGVGLVSWRMVHRDHRPPVPGALLGVTGLFLAMALVSDVFPAATSLVTVTAWGLDVAAFLDVLPAGLGGQIKTAEQKAGTAEGATSGNG
jgi:hypothetical protein